MSLIKIKCNDQVLTPVETPDIFSGDINTDYVQFDFCEIWSGYTKTVVFYRTPDEVYNQLLGLDNACTIPKEVLKDKGDFYIGVFGAKGEEILTSQVIKYRIYQGAITEDLIIPDPTPDIYEQLLQAYNYLYTRMITTDIISDNIEDNDGGKVSSTALTYVLNTMIKEHKEDTNNPHKVTKGQVGLGNVENKSSETIRGELTAQNVKDALNYTPAELDENGLVLSSQLPSYVDDVLEFDTLDEFPKPGESGKIYVATTTNLSYRWGGSDYVTITSDIALGETSATAYRGDRGKIAYDHSQLKGSNPHNVSKSDVGLGAVDNTSDLDKPISTATQKALDDLGEGIADVLYKANQSEEASLDGSVTNYVMESDLGNIVSDLYDNTKTYVVGDYCIRDNHLYKCNTDITTPEEFTADKWDATTCASEFDSLNNKLVDIKNITNRSIVMKNFTQSGSAGDTFSFTVKSGNGYGRFPVLMLNAHQTAGSGTLALLTVNIETGNVQLTNISNTAVKMTSEAIDGGYKYTVTTMNYAWGNTVLCGIKMAMDCII